MWIKELYPFTSCILNYRQYTVRVQFDTKRILFYQEKKQERADSIDVDKLVCVITENIDNVSCLFFLYQHNLSTPLK